MDSLTEQQLDLLADKVMERLEKKSQDFWIPREKHYRQHLFLEEFETALKDRKSSHSRLKEYILGVLGASALLYFIWYLGYSMLLTGKDFMAFVFNNPPVQ